MNSVLHYMILVSESYCKILCVSVGPYRYQACMPDYLLQCEHWLPVWFLVKSFTKRGAKRVQ